MKYKVALVCICLNPFYWPYIVPMIESARKHFLANHDVEFFLWSDLPEDDSKIDFQALYDNFLTQKNKGVTDPSVLAYNTEAVKTQIEEIKQSIPLIRGMQGVTVFPTEAVQWPYPTLMRYHLFLQQEEILSKFNYIFYCDADMLFVNTVDEEILGPDLTAAQHPMYAVRKEYIPPYEPNPQSKAYIPRPGRVIQENGMPRFLPLYFAGGFQGGTSESFIKAMKGMKKSIDSDLNNLNYVAVWNDETHWNKYCFDNPPSVALTPSYVYPDSLIEEYYVPIWGREYPPKLVTLTKKFTTSKAGGDQLRDTLSTMKPHK